MDDSSKDEGARTRVIEKKIIRNGERGLKILNGERRAR
jgi:hypothetical protein